MSAEITVLPGVVRITEEQSKVPVERVLKSAMDANLATVIIVGFDKLGTRHIYSSEGNYFASVGKLYAAANWLACGTPTEE
jgi:hypothetical protein